MQAVTWHGKPDVRVEEVPDPAIPPRAYEMFQRKDDGAIKILLTPA